MPSADKLRQDSRMERVLGAILSGSLQYTAADLYDAQAKLKVLTAEAHLQLDKVGHVADHLHHRQHHCSLSRARLCNCCPHRWGQEAGSGSGRRMLHKNARSECAKVRVCSAEHQRFAC